jgi:hypothetical protein
MSLLERTKRTLKRTPGWRLLRPRRVHVYGVGAPKTGTASVAQLFGDYRSFHEAQVVETINLIQQKRAGRLEDTDLRCALQRRDRELNLECEVAHYLVHVCEELAALFPEARFVCTVRNPRSWLRSFIDQSINLEETFSKHLDDAKVDAWRTLRRINCGPPPETYPDPEAPLARYGLPSLDGYLSYWASHNRTLLDVLPADRRLFVPTHTLTAAAENIRSFAGADPHAVPENTYANTAHCRHGVLDAIDDTYVHDQIQAHCAEILDCFADLGVDLKA